MRPLMRARRCELKPRAGRRTVRGARRGAYPKTPRQNTVNYRCCSFLSVLFVPTCTSMDPPYPLPMICSTLSVTCSILAPVDKLLRPPPAQSCICLPNYRVSHVNLRVSLSKPLNNSSFVLPPIQSILQSGFPLYCRLVPSW